MTVDRNEGWLRLALRVAGKSRNSCFWHVALIRKGGKILSVAPNRDTCHAEIAAMRLCTPAALKNSECLSLRFSLTDRLSSAKPCPECEAAMRDAGVKRCYYSVPFDRLEKMNLTVPSTDVSPRYRNNNYRVSEMRKSWID